MCPEQLDPDTEPEKNNPYHKSSYKKKAVENKANKDSPEADGRKVKEADKNKPVPREPLKKTSGNNWAHVICAVWTPEVKFSDAKTMKCVEGVGLIPSQRWKMECKVCKGSNGATVQCTACHASGKFAHPQSQVGTNNGQSISTVQTSLTGEWVLTSNQSRDLAGTVSIVKIGNETGNMVPCIWCPEHDIKSNVHAINEVVDDAGTTALELYLKTYKQADLTLTGTVRKANLMTTPTKPPPGNRRNSLVGNKEGADLATPVFIKVEGAEPTLGGEEGLIPHHVGGDEPKQCMRCKVEYSPLWWDVPSPVTTNGDAPSIPPATTNGETPKEKPHVIGLMCHRCHTNDKETPLTPLSSKPLNGLPTGKIHPAGAAAHLPRPAAPAHAASAALSQACFGAAKAAAPAAAPAAHHVLHLSPTPAGANVAPPPGSPLDPPRTPSSTTSLPRNPPPQCFTRSRLHTNPSRPLVHSTCLPAPSSTPPSPTPPRHPAPWGQAEGRL